MFDVDGIRINLTHDSTLSRTWLVYIIFILVRRWDVGRKDTSLMLLRCSGDFTISLSRSDKPVRRLYSPVSYSVARVYTLIKSLHKTERGSELLCAVKQRTYRAKFQKNPHGPVNAFNSRTSVGRQR